MQIIDRIILIDLIFKKRVNRVKVYLLAEILNLNLFTFFETWIYPSYEGGSIKGKRIRFFGALFPYCRSKQFDIKKNLLNKPLNSV